MKRFWFRLLLLLLIGGIVVTVLLRLSQLIGGISANASAWAAVGAVGSAMVAVLTLAALLFQTMDALSQAVTSEKVLRIAQEQARISNEALTVAREQRLDSMRPVLVPARAQAVPGEFTPTNGLLINNIGAGPALNVVVKVCDADGKVFECHFPFVVVGPLQTPALGFSKKVDPPEYPTLECIHNDVFGRVHRTVAKWKGKWWTEISCDVDHAQASNPQVK